MPGSSNRQIIQDDEPEKHISMAKAKADPKKRQDAEGFYKELLNAPDRAAAVLAAAMLDAQLHELLKSFFIENEQTTLEILDRLQFAMKIQLAYCLGLIPMEDYEDLTLIKEIRNQFGHGLHGLSFDEPGITEKCNWFRKFSASSAELTPRHKFLATLNTMRELLEIQIELFRRELKSKCKSPKTTDFP
jgi:DNA-binding MltR family transcriptional regulator